MSADIAMYAPPHKAFRLGTLIFAALLGAQCIWLVLPEVTRPGVDRLPSNAQAAGQIAKKHNDAVWAAWIGAIRGDLWAESAFTHADLLWAGPDARTAIEHARAELDKALAYAPHQADAWLMLAGLEARDPSHEPDPVEALKMSYYTGPSERPLIPLRLQIATHLDAVEDIEVQQFIRRDLRFLLAQQQRPLVAEAYAAASPAGRKFIEQVVGEIEPAYLGPLRTRKP